MNTQCTQLNELAKDAEEWGDNLNRATWAAFDAWDTGLMGPMSGAVFNNIKGVIRAAVLEYVKNYQSSQGFVGLTETEWREIDDAHDWRTTLGRIQSCKAIEDKIRKKNNGK